MLQSIISRALSWHPPVGVFIAILALLGVLVPWFRTESSKKEKAFWTFVMFVLVGLEIRSITIDHMDFEHDRKEQTDRFDNIAKGINASIQAANASVRAATAALENTIPRAELEVQHIAPYRPTFPIAPDRAVEFNLAFTNAGNDVVKRGYIGARMYVDIPDNAAAAQRTLKNFNRWWDSLKHHSIDGLRPNAPGLISFSTDKFSQNDVEALLKREKTLYMFVRFKWSDRTGDWTTDECYAFQNPNNDLEVTHPCMGIGDRHRYK